MHRQELRRILFDFGLPLTETRNDLDYFCENALQVEYGNDDEADFIGVSCHQDYLTFYYGVNVFDTPAKRLFRLVAERDGSGNHVFDPSGYTFPNQIITLWEADEQYDKYENETRKIWAQIGLGTQHYLDDVSEIRSRHTYENSFSK
jgi:hypothetical protein